MFGVIILKIKNKYMRLKNRNHHKTIIPNRLAYVIKNFFSQIKK